MWTLPSCVRIYVAAEPMDLRRGFDGLAAATRSVIGQSPLSGHLFVFLNRRAEPCEDPCLGIGLGTFCCTRGWSEGPLNCRRHRVRVIGTLSWTLASWD